MKSNRQYGLWQLIKRYFLRLVLPMVILFFEPVCKKQKSSPPPTLPEITEEGKNTIGFMLDGELWLPSYKCGMGRDLCGKLDVQIRPYTLITPLPLWVELITLQTLPNNRLEFFSISPSPDNNGIWPTTGEKLDSFYFVFRKPGQFGTYERYPFTKRDGSYFKVTKLDMERRIFSAVFDLWLYSSTINDKADSVHITNGRLDTRFRVCKCDGDY